MLEDLTTEERNPSTTDIDSKSAIDIVNLINDQDAQIAEAVRNEANSIAKAIDQIANSLRTGGRLIYVGAGTSGRLGVLDASECPPTFRTEPWQVVGVIAGGERALTRAVEGAEDEPERADSDLRELKLTEKDSVIGIATSGRTPYVLRAMDVAKSHRAKTIGISCNRNSELDERVDIMISPVVGPEVIAGSTRMKAGTATKLVLNMLSTGAMIRIGKTFGNRMIDLRATNSKLVARSKRIIRELTGMDESSAVQLIEACDGELKTAIASHWLGVGADEARQKLDAVEGHLHLLRSDEDSKPE